MPRATPAPSTHEWFRARLAPQLLGLLEDDAERRLLAHARECAECAEHMKAFASAERDRLRDGGHIPPRLLARWDRARVRLRGMTRRMVRAHLEGCEACRQELEMLGHVPVLEVIAGLEADEGELSELSARHRIAPPGSAHARGAASAGSRGRWFVGGAITGAVAAAAVFLVVFPARGPLPGETAGTGRGPAPTSTPASDAAPSPASLHVMPPLVRLESPTRSGGPSPAVVTVGAGDSRLMIRLPDLHLEPGEAVRVVMTAPHGGALIDTVASAGDLSAPAGLLLDLGPASFEPGRHRLELRMTGSPGLPIAEFAIEVRVRTP